MADNRAIFRRLFEEIFNDFDLDALDEVLAPDIVNHSLLPSQKPGLEGAKELMRVERVAVPNWALAVGMVLAEGDKVAAWVTATGLQERPLFGFEPTGMPFEIDEIEIGRFEAGRLAELWSVQNTLAAALGAAGLPVPTPKPSVAAAAAMPASQPDAGAATPGPDATRDACLAYYEHVVSGGDLGRFDELVDIDLVDHAPLPGWPPDAAGLRKGLTVWRKAFPDLHVTVLDVITEGDLAALRTTVTGTHRDAFLGIAPTGAVVEFEHMAIHRVWSGRIVETWSATDGFALLRQLGALSDRPHPAPVEPPGRAVVEWIENHASRLVTLDPAAELGDLAPLGAIAADAAVVGFGASTRGAHELSAAGHRVLRFLVEELGFRTLALDEGWTEGMAVDAYVRTGTGDPRALLAAGWPPWRNEEMLGVIRWIRAHNEAHVDDMVRVLALKDDDGAPAPPDIDWVMADRIIRWHGATGGKVVYWGANSHASVGDPVTLSLPPAPGGTIRNIGSYLRGSLGPGYMSIGFTFDHGSIVHRPTPCPVPPPPPTSLDWVLGQTRLDAYLLGLHGDQPAAVRAWLGTRGRMRFIGPEYDAANDAAYHLAGGSLAEWFDAIVHVNEVTPFLGLAP